MDRLKRGIKKLNRRADDFDVRLAALEAAWLNGVEEEAAEEESDE